MILSTLQNWESTRQTLHQAAQVIGGIKKVSVQPLLNYAHLGLYVTKDGLTTGSLSDGGELLLNFITSSVVYTCPKGDVSTVPLQDHSQSSLTESVLKVMADAGHPAANVDRASLDDQTLFALNPTIAADYQEALYAIYTAIARFRARLFGSVSPVIVFPHGFDLSFLWFKRGSEERTDPHLNFGFSPGSAGFPRPYIYSYASPLPEGYFDVTLPAPARFTRDSWKGIVIDYDTLVSESDPETVIEQALIQIHAAVAPLLT